MTQHVAWSVPPAVLAARVNKRVEDWVKLLTLEMFTRVIMRSPVDTGRFRANWFPAYGEPSTSINESTDKEGTRTVQVAKSSVMAWPIGGVVYLTNSLPYAAALEYGLYPNPPKYGSKKRGEDGVAVHVSGGFSMQAPQGMVRMTAAEVGSAMAEALRQTAA